MMSSNPDTSDSQVPEFWRMVRRWLPIERYQLFSIPNFLNVLDYSGQLLRQSYSSRTGRFASVLLLIGISLKVFADGGLTLFFALLIFLPAALALGYGFSSSWQAFQVSRLPKVREAMAGVDQARD